MTSERNELETLISRFNLDDVASTLADLIDQNDRSRSLNEITIRLAMAYGARAAMQAQVHADTFTAPFFRPYPWRYSR